MKSFFVLHVDDEEVCDVMDGVLYRVPPSEPFEFANPFIGKRFIEHKWFHGVVEVELEKTRSGWIFKIEDAYDRAVAALAQADNAYNQSYIETQHQDRLLRGVPAMPPSVRQKKILQRQGVNLEDYGIRPIGTKSSQERMFEEMARQNNTLMSVVTALLEGRQVQPSERVGLGRSVQEPVHTTLDREDVLVPPRPPAKPRNIVAPPSAVVERPDPVQPQVRLYGEGEDPETDPSVLGPEFEGDVNDPNQVPGPKITVADKPLDLNESPIGSALNMGEGRVTLKIPSPKKRRLKPLCEQELRPDVIVADNVGAGACRPGYWS